MEFQTLTTPEATEAGVAALAAVGALWLLMTQETVVEDVETRITRKIRQDCPATVTRPVVAISERRLRRRRYRQEEGGSHGSQGGASGREYTSRWWVRGHWRHQPYGPKRALRKPIFIEPHTAGPADTAVNSRRRVERWKQ